jgi:glycerol uptake facilitator-like aquaporin
MITRNNPQLPIQAKQIPHAITPIDRGRLYTLIFITLITLTTGELTPTAAHAHRRFGDWIGSKAIGIHAMARPSTDVYFENRYVISVAGGHRPIRIKD